MVSQGVTFGFVNSFTPLSNHSNTFLTSRSLLIQNHRSRISIRKNVKIVSCIKLEDSNRDSWRSLVPKDPISDPFQFENEINDLTTLDSGGGESNSDPPTGPNGGGDSDSGGGERKEVLQRFGLTEESLSPELQSLPAKQLQRYLSAIQNPFTGFLSRVWPGWRKRVAGDPDFPFKLLMEETVGLGLAASGMIAARGKNILAELDLALCDISVGATLNFILVYLLTPVIGAKGGMLARLPSNVFSTGTYTMSQRAVSFLYKGILFSVCGFMGSMVGTSLSQGLLVLRRQRDRSRGIVKDDDKKLPGLFVTSAAWAWFMFISSNPRYQALAGAERLLFKMAPKGIAQTGCGALRTANNVLGGANWVWLAKKLKIQEPSK